MFNRFVGLSLLLCAGILLAQEPSATVHTTQQPTDGPVLIKQKKPKYPKNSRKAKVQGTVRLRATIGTDGRLKNVTVIEGDPLLADAAKEAVLQWRYQPARRNGEPVEVSTNIDINFYRDGQTSARDDTEPGLLDASVYSKTHPEPPEGVFRVGNGVSAPRAILAPDPEYPKRARKKHQQGRVIFYVVVTEQGLPRDIKITQSLTPELDAKAYQAVSNWKFSPAMKDGKPVAVLISIEMNFKLH
jgi:TonB family protein